VVATYEIMHAGRPVVSGLFKSFEQIQDCIRDLPPGIYQVYRELPRDRDSTQNSEFFGEFTRHKGGEVSYSPVQQES